MIIFALEVHGAGAAAEAVEACFPVDCGVSLYQYERTATVIATTGRFALGASNALSVADPHGHFRLILHGCASSNASGALPLAVDPAEGLTLQSTTVFESAGTFHLQGASFQRTGNFSGDREALAPAPQQHGAAIVPALACAAAAIAATVLGFFGRQWSARPLAAPRQCPTVGSDFVPAVTEPPADVARVPGPPEVRAAATRASQPRSPASQVSPAAQLNASPAASPSSSQSSSSTTNSDADSDGLEGFWRARRAGCNSRAALDAELAALNAELRAVEAEEEEEAEAGGDRGSDTAPAGAVGSPEQGANVSITAGSDAELLAELEQRAADEDGDSDGSDGGVDVLGDEPLPSDNAAWRRWFDEHVYHGTQAV